MEKKVFYKFESNGDLSYVFSTIEGIHEIIESDLEGISNDEIGEIQYTITPFLMTDEEFENMPEAEC